MTTWEQMLSKVYRVALLLPFAYWAWLIFSGSLGVDPAKNLNHKTGDMALYYLLGNLAIGILISFRFRFPSALRFLITHRRFLGVVTFLILICHFLLYLTMEGFQLQGISQIPTKLYLALGFSAWLILLMMALTSNNRSVRRLGGKRWKRLHRAVYAASALITVHVLLIEKIDLRLFKALFIAYWLAQGARFVRYRRTKLTSPSPT